MNSTKNYYNRNAREYADMSFEVDVTEHYNNFLKYIPENGKIIDIGCGSCRDVLAFMRKGYCVDALDQSEEFCRLALERYKIEVINESIEEWVKKNTHKYNGIWACASMHHLKKEDFVRFVECLDSNLVEQGVCYISLKNGIKTGEDKNGRYQQNYSKDNMIQILLMNEKLQIRMLNESDDKMGRNDFTWINVIVQKRGDM
ncbi:class I SAM-dependent methyltransferase [Anaeromicropila populeti]|uniref:Methyltransferase domain-containing protein n=1 Tax=Anaeromicropila populeti TaxID=37658 RepID=A0A1I6HTC4_9FIRM|nr:class I SAM-dependent methyltransferase [Anaeromicropila populeti]SFR57695.1 Methyltransferase domain-containing protein [Anaeromicropila populeti]